MPRGGRAGLLPWDAGVVGMETTKKTAPTEAIGRKMDAGQDSKTEILPERGYRKPQRTEASSGTAFSREVFDVFAGHPHPHFTPKHPVSD